MPNPKIAIFNKEFSAEISPTGAELQRLTLRDGSELLWNGDPAYWKGRAPILFPVVGMLAGGEYRLGGRSYRLSKHGFARDSLFQLISHSTDQAIFRLRPTPQTGKSYPFAFRLDVAFALSRDGITMSATVTNEGVQPMPASFGFHPAIRWPLPFGGERADHIIRFAEPEPDPIRRIDGDGLMTPVLHPNPIEGTDLRLRDELFLDDAMILEAVRSRSLLYGAPGFPALKIAFDGLPSLGLWTKPGAGYLCIEPWQGHADPQGFDGDISEKPGMLMIPGGGQRTFRMALSVGPTL